MLSYKMDFSSCGIVLGFGKSSHIWYIAKPKLVASRVEWLGEYITFVRAIKNEPVK